MTALGPEQGRIVVRTTREGVAAKVGHDLEIEFGSWSGELELPDGDPGAARVSARVQVNSLRVVSGVGGVAALTDGDRQEITRSALKVLDADRHPNIEFRSEKVRSDGDGGELTGALQIAGSSAPLILQVTATGPQTWRATGTIRQTSFGIKPYKAFLGALRLSDQVGIEVDIRLSGA
ncbi:MAG TPA: YceI family protein [Sporichthyaceae bacterium]|jgi:polyisoprenoid-binding protein YceI